MRAEKRIGTEKDRNRERETCWEQRERKKKSLTYDFTVLQFSSHSGEILTKNPHLDVSRSIKREISQKRPC